MYKFFSKRARIPSGDNIRAVAKSELAVSPVWRARSAYAVLKSGLMPLLMPGASKATVKLAKSSTTTRFRGEPESEGAHGHSGSDRS